MSKHHLNNNDHNKGCAPTYISTYIDRLQIEASIICRFALYSFSVRLAIFLLHSEKRVESTASTWPSAYVHGDHRPRSHAVADQPPSHP